MNETILEWDVEPHSERKQTEQYHLKSNSYFLIIWKKMNVTTEK